MGTITTNSIITRAGILIQDQTGVRWPQDELLSWLNDGQREIVLIRPQASTKNTSMVLVANSTKQSIPSDGIMLIDITRNLGSNGSTPGSAIRAVTREILDSQLPDWHSLPNSGSKIVHYVFDQRDPRNFYVFPKAPATAHHIEIIYSSAPTDATDVGTIQIDDIYANALLDYILYRAYSKDAEYVDGSRMAVAYYQAFTNSLGIKASIETAQNPAASVVGINPNVRGAPSVGR